MITNTASHASHSGYLQENDPAIRATDGLIKSGRRLPKWFGIGSTVLIGAAALLPNLFGIPADMQPWVFLLSIFWYFAFCTGMFDL